MKESARVLPCRIPPRLPTNPPLFSREGAREPDSWSTLSHTVHSGDYSVKHHRGLDVYLLTAEAKEGTAASWERDIRHLQMHMQSHHHQQVSKGLAGCKSSRSGWLQPGTWGGLLHVSILQGMFPYVFSLDSLSSIQVDTCPFASYLSMGRSD